MKQYGLTLHIQRQIAGTKSLRPDCRCIQGIVCLEFGGLIRRGADRLVENIVLLFYLRQTDRDVEQDLI